MEGRNPLFGLESRGFSHIPEAERNMTLASVGPMWLGANLNMYNVTLGCVGYAMGIGLWPALAAVVVGNLPYAYLGIASIGSVRAGVPVTTFSRSVYGVDGNRIHALISWASSVCFEVFNAILGALAWLSLLAILGLDRSSVLAKLSAIGIQLVLGGGIAVFGHATMVYLQRYFAVALGAVFVLVIGWTLPQVHWSQALAGQAHGGGLAVAAAFVTACGVIASQPVSYVFNGPDWVRYLPSQTPGRALFHRVFWWSFLPSVLLAGAGVLWASLHDMTDPVAGLQPLLPGWLFLLFVLLVIAGSIANNAPTFYSSGLCLQAAGLRLSRLGATLLDIGISGAAVVYIMFLQDLTTVLNNFVSLLVAWSGPYAGVWLCDGILRRWRFDLEDIHPTHPRAGGFGRKSAWAAYFAGMAVAVVTMKCPLFQGPVNRLLDGMDLSWVLGLLVSAGTYALFAGRGALSPQDALRATDDPSPQANGGAVS